MDYQDYLELRRRAEKRLTVISAWPFVAFQSVAYLLMFGRSSQQFAIAFLAGCVSLIFTAGTYQLVRRRTATNREQRRDAIDVTLEDAVATGWPLEEPSPRELRLLASLLDDDLETRAGFGKTMVWLTAIGATLWLPAFYTANMNTGIIPFQGTGLEFFALWLFMLASAGLMLYHRRARKAAERRVRTTLERTSSGWNTAKLKRPPEAPWWRDEDEDAGEKLKREAWDDETGAPLGDDGELSGGYGAGYQRLT